MSKTPPELTRDLIETAVRAEAREDQAKTLRWLGTLCDDLRSELDLDDVEWCCECGEPIMPDDEVWDGGDGPLCDDCVSARCTLCREPVGNPATAPRDAWDGTALCDDCAEFTAGNAEECGGE